MAELLAMSLWFSGSAVVPQLQEEWILSSAEQSWMTMSVQLGFVVGAVLSAVLNLADRIPAPRLIAICTILGGLFNGAIPLFDAGPGVTILMRFLTGVTLAGVYPPGMKLVATWCREDRGCTAHERCPSAGAERHCVGDLLNGAEALQRHFAIDPVSCSAGRASIRSDASRMSTIEPVRFC